MTTQMFLLFSHQLTPQQAHDARTHWGVTDFVPLPAAYQQLWSHVPPGWSLEELEAAAHPLLDWVKQQAQSGDLALIQGDYGMVFLSIVSLQQAGLIPVYATTERISREFPLADGSVSVQKIFQHVQFRAYPVS